MTTLVAHVLGQWAMKVQKPEGQAEWFLDWVLRSPKDAGIHLTAGWHAYNSLLSVLSPSDVAFVREYFGGMGVQSLVIRKLFGQAQHTVMDYSWDAVRHLEDILPPYQGFDVRQADAYDPASDPDYSGCEDPDLVGLDFGDLTVWKTRDGEPHRQLLDRVFDLQPKGVVITDIACRYLHLHRSRYESLLGAGTCESYDSYLEALSGRLSALYGYELVAGFKHRWSTVFAMVPAGQAIHPGRFHPTPAEPVGIELL